MKLTTLVILFDSAEEESNLSGQAAISLLILKLAITGIMMSSNTKWLRSYIGAQKILNPDRAISITDLASNKCIYASDSYLKITNSGPEIFKKPFAETNSLGVEYAEIFADIAAKVVKTGKNLNFFVVLTHPEDKLKHCFSYTMSVVINPETNEKLATQNEIKETTLDFVQQTFSICHILSTQKQYSKKEALGYHTTLSQREKEILFLLMIGCSQKAIADILSKTYNKEISTNTISSVICRQLLEKLDVYNISDLIHKSIHNRLIRKVPYSLLAKIEGVFCPF